MQRLFKEFIWMNSYSIEDIVKIIEETIQNQIKECKRIKGLDKIEEGRQIKFIPISDGNSEDIQTPKLALVNYEHLILI